MGIYPSGAIYGVRITQLVGEDSDIIFEKIYDSEMNNECRNEVKEFYKTLEEKNANLRFQIYTECSSTYRKDIFMMWLPIPFEKFRNSFV